MTEIEAIERQIKALREQANNHLIGARNQPWCATSLTQVAELETEQAEALERAKEKLESQSAKEKAFDILCKHFDIQVGYHQMFGHWVFLESSDENSPQQSDLTKKEAEIIRKAME